MSHLIDEETLKLFENTFGEQKLDFVQNEIKILQSNNEYTETIQKLKDIEDSKDENSRSTLKLSEKE